MSFETELSKGIFCIPRCRDCKKTVWPPVEFCSYCLGKVQLEKGEFEGKIIEFSKQKDNYFCIVEFENVIRIIAKMKQTPKTSQKVRISDCGIADDNYFFHVI